MSTSGHSGWARTLLLGLTIGLVLPASIASAASPQGSTTDTSTTAAAGAAAPTTTAAQPTTTPTTSAPTTAATAAVEVATTAPTAAAELVADAACGGLLRLAGTDLCSHGADPHEGHDHDHDFAASAAPAPAGPTGSTTPASGCSNGTSGPRVLAVYAVPSGAQDRYNEFVGHIRTWAGVVSQSVRDSSANTRSVRWALDGNCEVIVRRVVVSAAARDSFSQTINDLAAAGLNRPDRRYLIWFDAAAYCGIATLWTDDRAATTNANNGGRAAYGRIDRGCWGGVTELHELAHMMGGVQGSAPHATDGGHCTDESDVLCYADGPGVQTTASCPTARERLLDCNGDDYFNASPAPGSYLATHWNVANSSFLDGAPLPPAAVEHHFEGSLSGSRTSERHPFAAGTGQVTVHVQHATGPSTNLVTTGVAVAASGVRVATGSGPLTTSTPATWTVRVLDGSGRELAKASGTSGSLDLQLSVPAVAEYQLEIKADGNGTWSATVVAPWA